MNDDSGVSSGEQYVIELCQEAFPGEEYTISHDGEVIYSTVEE